MLVTAHRPYTVGRRPATRRPPAALLACAALLVLAAPSLAQLAPLPFGWAVTPDQSLLFRTELASASVSVTDLDPASPTWLRVVAVIPVGHRPAGIAASPDGLDVLVANHGDDTLSLIDVATLTVRKTLAAPALDGPWDVVAGPLEDDSIAFGSGTWHGYVSNRGGEGLAVFESGPDGVAGLGFDDVLGAVDRVPAGASPLLEPRGAVFDPVAPLDAFSSTVGAFVAHASPAGVGIASRVLYTADDDPGPTVVDTTVVPPGFHGKRFEVVQQFVSTHVGQGLDVAVADESLSVSSPTRLYLSMTGGVVDVFDLASGTFLLRVETGVDIVDLAPYLQP